MLHCKNISVHIAGSNILDDVSAQFNSGTVSIIAGANGAGKSTLMRVICGLMNSNSGFCFWEDQNISELSILERSRLISWLPQRPSIAQIAMPVRMVLSHALNAQQSFEDESVQDILRQCHCQEFLDRALHECSGGEQQRVFIARALLQQSKIILLDEPTLHLDPAGRENFSCLLSSLKNTERLILCSSHDSGFIQSCADELLWLKEGQVLAFGATSDVFIPDYKRKAWGITKESVVDAS